MNIAMIPARMGSQRLKRKNLRELGGETLIARAIRKCIVANVFDEIWVNSEDLHFLDIAKQEGAKFHHRPKLLGDDQATSEQFVSEFLERHPCERLFQVHTIAPLLTVRHVKAFVGEMIRRDCDVLLSCVLEQTECMINKRPINFVFSEKANSQHLTPVQRIVWAITGWRTSMFLQAVKSGHVATYAGSISLFPLDRVAGHVIKTEDDLRIAEALLNASSI